MGERARKKEHMHAHIESMREKERKKKKGRRQKESERERTTRPENETYFAQCGADFEWSIFSLIHYTGTRL